MTKKEWLEDHQNQLQETYTQLETKANQLSWIRLGTIVPAVILAIAGMVEWSFWMLACALVLLVGFGIIYTRHEALKRRLQHIRLESLVVDRLLARFDDRWQKEEGEAKTSWPVQDHYLYDLDVLGPRSLWSYLCFLKGEAAREDMLSLLTSVGLEHQASFHELASHPQLVLDIIVENERLSVSEQRKLAAKLDRTRPEWALQACLVVYPLALLASLYLLLTASIAVGVVGCVLASVFFQLFYASRFQNRFDQLAAFLRTAKGMVEKSEVILSQPLQSDELAKLQQALAEMKRHYASLQRLFQAIQVRYNPLLYLFFNMLCLYGGWLYVISMKTKSIDFEKWQYWEKRLARFESLTSLSTWLLVKEHLCDPIITTDHLSFEELCHPLMSEERAVGATASFDPCTCVITGSNMAGKTTFMRSLGLNLILVRIGLPAKARRLETPLLDVFTSMRVADDVNAGVSTFYGELMRIREMIDHVSDERPALYLIDEIFKGTNLKDRIIGAKAALQKLHVPHSFTFVSTHDEQLCSHEHIPIINIHFQEDYVDDKIVFDYRLKPGMATSTNAHYLMKMIGIIETGEEQ
ncbi:DNA mismatch repair protein MutS [Clostridiales bacterium CHKCI006]|nr:DNA mismatch repair protein MutS [Clostridiales bacterium CHKCI006]